MQSSVLRPGFVQVRVLDMEKAIAHYRDIMGLDLVGIESDGRAYLRAYDEFDRHSVVLRETDTTGLDIMAFKMVSPQALLDARKALEARDVKCEVVAAGEQPGVGERLRVYMPTGHVFDFYVQMDLSDIGPMTKNPEIWREEPRGMRIVRFDHCALLGGDIDASAKLLIECFGFSSVERGLDPDGNNMAIFLSCSNKAHDVAFLKAPVDGKLHHVSFLLESWHDIGNAADLMARRDVKIDIGPTRHGITRGQTIYFFDPSGNRNETFAGGYSFYPDNPERVWTADQFPKGLFYYEREVVESFVSVFT